MGKGKDGEKMRREEGGRRKIKGRKIGDDRGDSLVVVLLMKLMIEYTFIMIMERIVSMKISDGEYIGLLMNIVIIVAISIMTIVI